MNMNMTRRGPTLILGNIITAPVYAQPRASTAIHQEADFKAASTRIYEALLDAKQFAAFTKDTAEIQRQAGGSFKLFGGRIEGRNIELAPNRRIVQAWRPSDWPAGVYTNVRFELIARGSGTRIVFDQAGLLENEAEWKHLNEGWPRNYWNPLRKYIDG
jgi:activator of HSP90 ATPase